MTDNDKPNSGDGTGNPVEPPPYVPPMQPVPYAQQPPQAPPPYEPPQPDLGTTPEPADTEPDTGRGSISYQQAGVTQPKPPSLADQRAREVARRERAEAEAAEFEAQRKRKRRKRILIGTGVGVGVVAVVAVIYANRTPDPVTAVCTDNSTGVIIDDDYCDESYATSHGGYSSGGFVYIGGSSYRYNYGGSGSYGQKVSGGSYVAPSSNTPVKTASGKSVSRGGLGVGGSSSGGGKSGGS